MALSRPNPIGLEVVGDLVVPDNKDRVRELIRRIKAIDDNLQGWIRKQKELIRHRLGIRRPRNVPWPGCSNISIPLIDEVIRRWRPGMVSLVADADPVAFFASQESGDFDAARTIEPFFTFYFRDHMHTLRELVRCVDLVGSRGHCWSRQGWKYQTKRTCRILRPEALFGGPVQQYVESRRGQGDQREPLEMVAEVLMREYGLSVILPQEVAQIQNAALQLLRGAPAVKITYREVQDDRASWMTVDPINVIVDPDQPDPQDADFLVFLHEVGPNQLRSMAADGHIPIERAKTVIERMTKAGRRYDSPSDQLREDIKDLLDRRHRTVSTRDVGEEMRIRLWEIYCRLDVNGDGFEERVVLWYAPSLDLELSMHEFVYPFDTWPVSLFTFSNDADRPIDQRGIAEMILPFQKLTNATHNARIDASQILLAPVFKIRPNSNKYESQVDWRPGALIPVANADDITPITHDLRILDALLREEQVTRRVAENYVGTFDATIQNFANQSERRTATEVEAITSLATSIFALDSKLFMDSMSRSFNQVWALYQEFGPEEFFFRVQGEPQPRNFLKSEIGKNLDVRAAGSPTSTNKSLILRNMERAMQVLLADQSGRVDKGRLIQRWLSLLDFQLSKDVVRGPEESAAVQAVLGAAQAVTGQPQQAF